MVSDRKNKRLRQGLAFLFTAAFILVMTPGVSVAGMDLMNEDALSDVQCQAGLSFAVQAQGTANALLLSASGALNFYGVRLDNNALNTGLDGYAKLGDYTTGNVFKLEAGSYNIPPVRSFWRLTFPNGYSTTNSLINYAPSLRANSVRWGVNGGGAYYLGALALHRIRWYDTTSITLWDKANGQFGLNGMIRIRGDIDQTLVKATAGEGMRILDFSFSSGVGNITNPAGTPGNGYFSFGTDGNDGKAYAPMQIDVYTDGATSTAPPHVRMYYPVYGSVVMRTTEIEWGTGTWHNFGPSVMYNMHPVSSPTVCGVTIWLHPGSTVTDYNPN